MTRVAFLLTGLLIGVTGVAVGQQTAAPDSARAPMLPPPPNTGYSIQYGASTPGVVRVRRRIAQMHGRGEPQLIYPIVVVTPQTPVTVEEALGAAGVPQQAPAQPGAPQQAAATPPPRVYGAPVDAATDEDLNAMEDRLSRRIDALYELIQNLPTREVIVQQPVPQPTPEQTPPPTTERVERPTLPTQPTPLPPANPNLPPTVREVERAILETGLFRAVGVNFELDKATLLPEAERTLDVVGEVLQKYPNLTVEVGGHTDASGSDAYNQNLSERRAASVQQYLVATFGIDPNQLVSRGYGEAQPIASNSTRTGRALNRRVEFKVLDTGTTDDE